MALPTAQQCKLSLSFNMVAKTMTVYADSHYLDPAINIGLKSFGTGNAKLTDPIGNEYIIDLSATDIPYVYNGSQTFPCTLDSNGNVLNGAYSINVGEFNLNYQGDPTTYTNVSSSFTLSYVAPTVVISQPYNVVEPSFVSTDITDYRVTDPSTQGFVIPDPISYSHKIYFPVNSNGFPNNTITTSTLSIALGAYEFYYGTQTGSVVNSVSYTFSDGLIVTDSITGAVETLVNPATDICSVVCGLNKLYSVMEANKNLNRTQYLLNKAEYEFLLSKTANAQANITCGNADQAQIQINDIKASLGDCCNDCSTYTDGDLVNGVGNPVFPYTPENVINKSQNIIADANNPVKYPSVPAIKNYVDSTFQPFFGNYTPEDVDNKSTNIVSDSGNNTKYPSVAAVEAYSEKLSNKSQDIQTDTGSTDKYTSVAAVELYSEKLDDKSQSIPANSGNTIMYPSVKAVEDYSEKLTNKSTSIVSNSGSNTKYPSVKAVQDYSEKLSSKSQSISADSGSTTKYPSVAAVQAFAQPVLTFIPEDIINKSQSITLSTGSTTEYPSVAAVESYAEKLSNKSTDTTLSASSNTLYPTQNAVKTYVDALTVGLLRDRGNYDAGNPPYLYPSFGGSGAGGAIKEGDLWYISVDGNLGSNSVLVGYSVRALVDSPGQTDANWSILNAGLGYIPEDVANKSQDINADAGSTAKYPSVASVQSYISSKISTFFNIRGSWDASAGYPQFGNGSGVLGAVMKGDAWYITTAGSVSGGYLYVNDWIVAKQNNPGNLGAFWSHISKAIGYVAENSANKTNDMFADSGSTTKYPSVYAVEDYVYQNSPVPSLNTVTNMGNVSTSDIVVDSGSTFSILGTTSVSAEGANTASYLFPEGSLGVSNALGRLGKIKNTNDTNGGIILEFPNKTNGSYTIATTADITVSDLQAVTNAGSATTNNITVNNLPAGYTSYHSAQFFISQRNTGTAAFVNGAGTLGITNVLGNTGLIRNTNCVNPSITLQFPNKASGSYTIATTDDVPANILQQVKVTLTPAQILALGSSPVTLIVGQANKVIVVHKMITIFRGGSSPYNNVYTLYTTGSIGSSEVIFQVITPNLYTERISFPGNGSNINNVDLTLYEGVSLTCYSPTPLTGGGDGTLDFYITYELITV